MQAIILIGPARSGTKILRDTIATHPQINKVGYDINFIWKKYNEQVPHDALQADQASPQLIRFVRKYFKKQAGTAPMVIEKTVSNTLRIPFVLRVFPNAKFVFLYRDGRDAVESVRRQWGTAPGAKYLIQKFLSVPFLDVIPYVIKYAIDLIRIKLKWKTTEDYVWGVKYPGYEKDLQTKSTLDFCAHQWKHCIEAMQKDQHHIDNSQMRTVHYEDFVTNPKKVLSDLATFLDVDANGFDTSQVKTGSVRKAKSKLTEAEYAHLNELLAPNLTALNYQ
ncbi:MAG: sulfotransferase [Bacteroidota bacterium]